jgi:hypothetical protein
MTLSAYDRTVAAWAQQWKADNLDAKTIKLIMQANQDLYEGPFPSDEDYPGFITACRTIKAALQDIPSVLYIDTETETWQEKKPEGERCDQCQGIGAIEMNDSVLGLVSEKCAICWGLGCFDPIGDWWKANQKNLKIALVGKELASYV